MPQMLTDHLLHADVGNVLWPLTLACCISVSLAASTVDGDDKSMSLQEIKTQRKTLAQRPRRIIFNNDGDDPGPPGTVTREKSPRQPHHRIARLSCRCHLVLLDLGHEATSSGWALW